MNCSELAARIERLQPTADSREVARLCLLLSNTVEDVEQFSSDEVLTAAWEDMALRLHAATDQHAAMTEELESLENCDPREFSLQQIWVLVRAVKVHSQILRLYLGDEMQDP